MGNLCVEFISKIISLILIVMDYQKEMVGTKRG